MSSKAVSNTVAFVLYMDYLQIVTDTLTPVEILVHDIFPVHCTVPRDHIIYITILCHSCWQLFLIYSHNVFGTQTDYIIDLINLQYSLLILNRKPRNIQHTSLTKGSGDKTQHMLLKNSISGYTLE